MLEKTAGILKWLDWIDVPSFKTSKSHLYTDFISDYNSDFNSYLGYWNRAKWNKKWTRNEFESLDTQKIDFYVLEK